jgi:hypothetical protein
MGKAKYLYHASPVQNLKTIEPRALTVPQDFVDAPCVFATDNFAFATMFLVPHDDSWANGGAFGSNLFFVVSDKDRYLETDYGGSVYLVLSKKFKNYNRKEWFSCDPVKTHGSVNYSSGLTAMIVSGVQVYFTDKETYDEIQNAPDHGMTKLNSLISENEKWGLPVVRLEMYRGSKKKVG